MTFQETVNQALARLANPSIEVDACGKLAWPELANMLPPNSSEWLNKFEAEKAGQRGYANFDVEAYIRQSNELENFLPRPADMEPRKGINFPLADFATELRREITEWLKI